MNVHWYFKEIICEAQAIILEQNVFSYLNKYFSIIFYPELYNFIECTRITKALLLYRKIYSFV